MEELKTYKNVELVGEDFKNASLPPIRKDFIAKLENALMFMSYRDLNMWHSEGLNKISLNNFDGAWLVDVSLRHNDKDFLTYAPFGDLQVTPDMFPNMNIKLMNIYDGVGTLSKHRFLDAKEKRHLENYKYILSDRSAFLDYGKQKWWTSEDGFGFDKMTKTENGGNIILPKHTSLINGVFYDKKAVNAKIASEINDEDSPYLYSIRKLHMALQLSLAYDYEWSCYIKETPESLGVRIPIHPSSSKEVFMMRNLPEGKDRKRAIVNFVKDHYRTVKGCNNNERQILVQKHLRGDLKFNWRGLEVHIIPSPYDLRKLKINKKISENIAIK
jgi:hypothetical protein